MQLTAQQQENLRELREASGIGLSALARQIDADKGALSKWERGLTDDLDTRFVYRMANTLGYTMERVYQAFRTSRALYIEAQQNAQLGSVSAPAPAPSPRKKLAKATSAVA